MGVKVDKTVVERWRRVGGWRGHVVSCGLMLWMMMMMMGVMRLVVKVVARVAGRRKTLTVHLAPVQTARCERGLTEGCSSRVAQVTGMTHITGVTGIATLRVGIVVLAGAGISPIEFKLVVSRIIGVSTESFPVAVAAISLGWARDVDLGSLHNLLLHQLGTLFACRKERTLVGAFSTKPFTLAIKAQVKQATMDPLRALAWQQHAY